MIKLVIFDLDGTLAESKSPITPEMGMLLEALLATVDVAVISGGSHEQLQTQLLDHLPSNASLERLALLPTCGTCLLRYTDDWQQIYSEDLDPAQRQKITEALQQAIAAAGFTESQTWGKLIEDRQSQITYSALGQDAPLDAKQAWDPQFVKRKKISALLEQALPDFSVRMGGATSIDVTLKGIDKAYGIRKLRDIIAAGSEEMLYVGVSGGNDFPARSTGATCIQVRDPQETQTVIKAIVACLMK